MDEITPFVWDTNQQTDIFGNLFKIADGFGDTSLKPESKDSPLTLLSPKEMGTKYYGTPKYDQNNIVIFGDGEVLEEKLEQVKIYRNSELAEFGDVTLILFASKDGALLLQQYKDCVLNSNEIAIFLEKDDPTNVLGSVMRIKVGTGVRSKDVQVAKMLDYIDGKKLNVDKKEVAELFEKGLYGSVGQFLGWALRPNIVATVAAQFAIFSVNNLNSAFVSFFEMLTIPDYRWNTETKEYNPLFFPSSITTKKNIIIKLQNKELADAPKLILAQLTSLEKGVMQQLGVLRPFLSKKMNSRFKEAMNKVFADVAKIPVLILDVEMGEISKTIPTFSNAFICGVINSVIDFFKGIFVIIGAILEAFSGIVAVISDWPHYLELLSELMENIYTVIHEFDLVKFIEQAKATIAEKIGNLQSFLSNITLPTPEISINVSKVGYICGYVVGLIATIVVDIYFTGGTKAVEDTAAAVQKFISTPGAALRDMAQVVKTKATVVIAEVEKITLAIVDFVHDFMAWMKEGGKGFFREFGEWLDEFVEWIRKLFKLENSPKIIFGKHSRRKFDLRNCGGKILNLVWENSIVTREGLEIVKNHLSRFDTVPANTKMLNRLEKILNGEIEITEFDKRFYTHEIRENERLQSIGFKFNETLPDDVYNNVHSASLEDYKIFELNEKGESILYHPEINQQIDFLNEFERKLIN